MIDIAKAGEGCSFDKPCAAGLYCDGAKCAGRKPAGEACQSHFECRGLCHSGKCEPFCGSE